MYGEFQTYPLSEFSTVANDEATNFINYVSPCVDAADHTFDVVSSTNPAPNSYTGTKLEVSVNSFTMTPSFCETTYRCDGVTFTDTEGQAAAS